MTQVTDRAAWLKGGDITCAPNVEPGTRAWRLVLLGPPGVGKGTQAEFLIDNLRTCHLSTGDVFRAAKAAAAAAKGGCACCCESKAELSPAMQTALEAMGRGELVTDETVLEMVAERAGCLKCNYGFLLDGFPRTLAQARALDTMLENLHQRLDAVLSYELPMDEIVVRLSGRRTCRGCKATFHLTNKKPKVEGVCDHCGGELYQREDDNAESIRTRLAAYEAETKPLADYYQQAGLLVSISADGAPQVVHERTMAALDARLNASR